MALQLRGLGTLTIHTPGELCVVALELAVAVHELRELLRDLCSPVARDAPIHEEYFGHAVLTIAWIIGDSSLKPWVTQLEPYLTF